MQPSIGKEFYYTHTVYFADTDAAKVVHHANYIRYFEAGRIEALKEIGFLYHELQEQYIGFAPVDIQVQYHAPLRLGDNYTVKTQLVAYTRVCVIFKQSVTCNEQVCCCATVKLACLNESIYKPVRIPKGFIDRLTQTET